MLPGWSKSSDEVAMDIGIAVLIFYGIFAIGVLCFWYARKQFIAPAIEMDGKKSECLLMPEEVESEMDALVRSALHRSRKAEPKKQAATLPE
jgi:hypothetical protein